MPLPDVPQEIKTVLEEADRGERSNRRRRRRSGSSAATRARASSKPYEVETYPGMVVLDAIHDIQAKQEPDARGPVELQGGALRLVQRRDQRQAAADVHDAHVAFRRGRADHGDADARVPDHQGSGDRRLVTTSRWRRRSPRSSRARATPTARGGCSRRTSIASRSSGSASSASSARTCATSSATTSKTRRSPGRAS